MTIDNTRNASDVFLKLVSVASEKPLAVRMVLVRGHDTLRFRSVSPGAYDIRYRDLDSGALSRSEKFSIEQVEEADGTRYSDLTITLYQVKGGNMHMEPITEAEF